MTKTEDSRRQLDLEDMKRIRSLLIGKGRRGFFEIRSSPREDGTQYGGDSTIDKNKWCEEAHRDCDFPVASDQVTAQDQKFWPSICEGMVIEVYYRTAYEGDWTYDQRDLVVRNGVFQDQDQHGLR